MTRRTTTSAIIAVSVCWSGCLAAQDASNSGAATQRTVAADQVPQQLTQLSTNLDQVRKEIADFTGPSSPDVKETTIGAAGEAAEAPVGPVTRAEFRELQAKVEAITDLIHSAEKKLEVVAAQNAELLTQLHRQNAEQSRMLAAISSEGSDGKPIPSLRAVMNDPQGRVALADAVHQVMRREGTVTIENRLGQGYSMRVNRQTYFIPAGGQTTLKDVPVGTVTTELLGYEAPKHWALTPPDYRLKIVIGHEDRQVVRRPAGESVSEIATPTIVAPAVEIVTPVMYDYGYHYTYYDPFWGWVVVP